MTLPFVSNSVRSRPGSLAVAALVVLILFQWTDPSRAGENETSFLRGDANADGRVSISDALMLRRWLLNGDRAPLCLDAADLDDSGTVEILDAFYVLNHIHLGGSPPPPPFPEPGPDPTADGLGCEEYDVQPAATSEDTIELGSGVARGGELVEVPVYLTNSVEVEAFQLVIRYQPHMFDPLAGDGRVRFDGAFLGEVGAADGPFYNAVRVLRDVPDDHVFVVGDIQSLLDTGLEVPPGERRHVFSIVGRVDADAKAGDAVILLPTNGPGGEGVGRARLLNEISSRGDARFVSTLPRLMPAVLQIVGDVTIFRGDVNRDGGVDIGDAVFALDYLFLGRMSPRCLDEADANDDGDISIVDPIAILSTLFLGSPRIAPPYPAVGIDPTPDRLPACPPRT
jgi:hypothetical protein